MTTKTATNPKGLDEPMWYRIRKRRPVSDTFMQNPRRGCLNQQHLFFSDDLTAIEAARKICASCPMLRPCTVWALSDHGCDLDGHYFWVVAGMDPDQRRRIREGKERFHDWTKGFSYSKRAARAAARERERNGERKRDQRRSELPLCPGCGSNQCVRRDRRDRTTNRQRYECTACGPYFLGEAL